MAIAIKDGIPISEKPIQCIACGIRFDEILLDASDIKYLATVDGDALIDISTELLGHLTNESFDKVK